MKAGRKAIERMFLPAHRRSVGARDFAASGYRPGEVFGGDQAIQATIRQMREAKRRT